MRAHQFFILVLYSKNDYTINKDTLIMRLVKIKNTLAQPAW